MKINFLDSQTLGQFTARLSTIIIGAFIFASGVNLFIIPNHFLSGGVSGIALLISYHTGMSVPLLVFVINIPIFLLGLYFMDKHYLISSIIALSSFTLFLHLLTPFQSLVVLEDGFLCAVFAGVFSGAGMGLIFKSRGSLGGTDIISSILKKTFSIPQPTSLLISNILIMILAISFGDLSIVLYSMISIYISSHFMEKLLTGLQRRKTVVIASKEYQKISDMILNEMERGATFMNGSGAYTGYPIKVIYTVIPTRQLARLKDKVYSIDPSAFINISNSSEIMGNWKQWNTHIYTKED